MAVREILRLGHPVLRRVARPLAGDELRSAEVRRLVADMVDTLRDAGGVGLAAPQVGVSVRLAVIEIAGGETRYGALDPMPLTVFVNPRVEVLDESTQGCWEGCLSVPGLRGWVERPRRIRVRHGDLDGREHAFELEGFPATVFQHEFDHLDGRLYVDRVDPRQLVFESELERHLAGA